MPISNNASYLPTMQDFIVHWTQVNAKLGSKPLVLADGFTLAGFTTLRTSIDTSTQAIGGAEQVFTQTAYNITQSKKALMPKLKLFRQTVQSQLTGTNYAASLPTLPNFGVTQSRFLKPFDDAAYLWNQINTAPPERFTPPLLLPDETRLADFQTLLSALRTLYALHINSDGQKRLALRQRDALLPTARLRMKQYRVAVFSRLAPGDPLLASVPRLSPVPGATPKAVTDLTLVYTPLTNTVKITFTPSVSANIRMYDLMFCPGPKWSQQSAYRIDTNENAPPFQFEFALTQVDPQAVALFKVVTMNVTENAKASKVLKAKRTGAQTLTSLTETPQSLTIAA